MYLPCMGSDLDEEGLDTPRHIGHWVDQGPLWNRVRLRQSELNPRTMNLLILAVSYVPIPLAEKILTFWAHLAYGYLILPTGKSKPAPEVLLFRCERLRPG